MIQLEVSKNNDKLQSYSHDEEFKRYKGTTLGNLTKDRLVYDQHQQICLTAPQLLVSNDNVDHNMLSQEWSFEKQQ